jgi:hypothetical protein
MMFRVVHTTPKRVLSHLLRLQREGEALLAQETLEILTEGMWGDRVFKYLRKISTDPQTFERVLFKSAMPLSLHGLRAPIRSAEEMTQLQKKHVTRNLAILAGAIEQFEAQYLE